MHDFSESFLWFQADKPEVDTEDLFQITPEKDALRVQNQHVNCLYKGLEKQLFNEAYNYFNKCLHFDFSPVDLNGKAYALSKANQDYLDQAMITGSIYLYAVNNAVKHLKLALRSGKVSFESPTDYVIQVLDKQYGVDTEVSLLLGAKILRTSPESHADTVRWRRRYYDK